MFERKNRISLDDYELNIIIRSLVEFRNQLLQEGRYTDAVDELLLKLASK